MQGLEYDNYKLQSPPKGNTMSLDSQCKCGNEKYPANNFCEDCQKKWELKFKKSK